MNPPSRDARVVQKRWRWRSCSFGVVLPKTFASFPAAFRGKIIFRKKKVSLRQLNIIKISPPQTTAEDAVALMRKAAAYHVNFHFAKNILSTKD